MKYKIWNKQDNLITPIGEVLTPDDVFGRYPVSELEGFKFVVCDAPISMGVFMELEQTKQMYKSMGVQFTDGMTDQDILDAITYFEENPPAPEPTAEERIASSLEFQNLMML